MLEISRMLTVSSVHISENTAQSLEDGEYISYPFDYGWFVYIHQEEDLPEDLEELFALAREYDCEWVKIDGDGEVIEELNTWQ